MSALGQAFSSPGAALDRYVVDYEIVHYTNYTTEAFLLTFSEYDEAWRRFLALANYCYTRLIDLSSWKLLYTGQPWQICTNKGSWYTKLPGVFDHTKDPKKPLYGCEPDLNRPVLPFPSDYTHLPREVWQ